MPSATTNSPTATRHNSALKTKHRPLKTRSRPSAGGWWFEAGLQRTALPYAFVIGPEGEFGIHAGTWVPLHGSIEGWVESVALADHARRCARTITTVTGEAVEALRLDGFEPVLEVAGLADGWWRGADSLVAVYRADAGCTLAPR